MQGSVTTQPPLFKHVFKPLSPSCNALFHPAVPGSQLGVAALRSLLLTRGSDVLDGAAVERLEGAMADSPVVSDNGTVCDHRWRRVFGPGFVDMGSRWVGRTRPVCVGRV